MASKRGRRQKSKRQRASCANACALTHTHTLGSHQQGCCYLGAQQPLKEGRPAMGEGPMGGGVELRALWSSWGPARALSAGAQRPPPLESEEGWASRLQSRVLSPGVRRGGAGQQAFPAQNIRFQGLGSRSPRSSQASLGLRLRYGGRAQHCPSRQVSRDQLTETFALEMAQPPKQCLLPRALPLWGPT